MIFVTVGTHEQQFNRLVQEIDQLVASGELEEEVFVQTGYSTFEPGHCRWEKFLPYESMRKMQKEASVVVSHGGPSTFMDVVSEGKVPVVVPRQKKFDEHVNDHQVSFVGAVANRLGGIIPVFDISELSDSIRQARSAVGVEFDSNNESFCNRLLRGIEGL